MKRVSCAVYHAVYQLPDQFRHPVDYLRYVHVKNIVIIKSILYTLYILVYNNIILVYMHCVPIHVCMYYIIYTQQHLQYILYERFNLQSPIYIYYVHRLFLGSTGGTVKTRSSTPCV